jgi:hypothetical protein
MREGYVGPQVAAEQRATAAARLGEPRLFFTTPGYDGWPLVMLRLAGVGTGRLGELITGAWRMRASAALGGEFGEPAG